MLQIPRRTGVSGPALVRLLARLTDADVPESTQSLSDRLSEWLGWTDAIALSTALKGNSPAVPSGARASASAEERECARVRSALAEAITDERAFAARRRVPARAPAQPNTPEEAVDYATYRQRYVALQQTMETGIGQLRGRLRTELATRMPGMARLAMVDAVMERVLGAREQSLLGAVPAMLEAHFERLQRAEQAAMADAQAARDPATAAAGAWLSVFRNDMQSVLLAELEIRFQPVEGLLAALRAS